MGIRASKYIFPVDVVRGVKKYRGSANGLSAKIDMQIWKFPRATIINGISIQVPNVTSNLNSSDWINTASLGGHPKSYWNPPETGLDDYECFNIRAGFASNDDPNDDTFVDETFAFDLYSNYARNTIPLNGRRINMIAIPYYRARAFDSPILIGNAYQVDDLDINYKLEGYR